MRQGCVPNFFIIGAPKCGTTSLHFYLADHPQISMSRVKEPHVLCSPRWVPSLGDYEGLLDCRAVRRGESSTGYSRYPAEGDAAVRIHELVPGAKLLYLVGNPVERIVSDYAQAVAVGVERRSIDEALTDFTDPAHWYVCASRYGMQIDQYLQYFDRSSLIVIDQLDLRDRREQTLRRVFEFLEVDQDFWSPGFRPELATREDHVRYDGLAWRLRGSVLGRVFRTLPPRVRLPASRAVRRRFANPPSRPTLDPALRLELADFLRPEVEYVQALVGKPLQHWLDGDPAGSPSG